MSDRLLTNLNPEQCQAVTNDPAPLLVLAGAGITQHLSQNRKNGLGRLWQKIAGFAADHANANTADPSPQ